MLVEWMVTPFERGTAALARPERLGPGGQIEADSDCVLMLYRDDYYDPDSERPGEMDIIVRKNRLSPYHRGEDVRSDRRRCGPSLMA